MEGFLELPPVFKKSGEELSPLIDRAEEIVKGLFKNRLPCRSVRQLVRTLTRSKVGSQY